MKKIELIALFSMLAIAGLLICTKIVIATLFTTGGAEYSQISAEKTVLEKENTVLKEKILANSSFNTIASQANTLGLDYNNKSRLVLSYPVPIAYKQ